MADSSATTQVLISGAGPTGLTAACLLAQLGVKVRIVDKNSDRSQLSKALGVQAGTLECLEAALGKSIVNQMIAAGRPVRKACLHLDEREPREIDLSQIPSKYDFILVLAQSETERILEAYLQSLGVKIERQTELTSIESYGDRIVAKVRHENGAEENLSADYAIGCDGAHSRVRRALGLAFDGGEYVGDFILGDVKLKWPWSYDMVRLQLNERGVIGGFPLPGERHYRLVMVVKGAPANTTPEISLAEFRQILNHIGGGKTTIDEAEWITRFRVHHRMVQQFQMGRIFLAGDAAHIHSPAGGQGMNTGIQDALNLGFKIKSVLDGAPRDLLEDYEAERLPVARNVLRATDFFSRMMLLSETPLTALLRERILPFLAGVPFVRRRIITAISEVRVARREIARYPRAEQRPGPRA